MIQSYALEYDPVWQAMPRKVSKISLDKESRKPVP